MKKEQWQLDGYEFDPVSGKLKVKTSPFDDAQEEDVDKGAFKAAIKVCALGAAIWLFVSALGLALLVFLFGLIKLMLFA